MSSKQKQSYFTPYGRSMLTVDEPTSNDNKSQIVATICLTLICCVLLATTHGEHGVGWFLAGLFLIWN